MRTYSRRSMLYTQQNAYIL